MIHGDPAAMITGGSCSVDFANEDGRQCFGIVCEMPYFLSKACMDESPAEGTRCDAVLKCYDLIDAHNAFMKPLVEELLPYLAENNAYALALKERMSMSEGNSEANRNFARTNPEYQQTVTKAQLFDNLIAMPFYTLLGVGMVKKAAENAAKDRPADAEKLLAYLKEKGLDVQVVKAPMALSGRYLAENPKGDGFCKLLYDRKNRCVVGVHLVGSYASEIIYGAAMMVHSKLPVQHLDKIVFPHPTVGEVVREALFLL